MCCALAMRPEDRAILRVPRGERVLLDRVGFTDSCGEHAFGRCAINRGARQETNAVGRRASTIDD